MSDPSVARQLPLGRLQMLSPLLGLAAAALCGLGIVTDQEQFFRSYLFGFVYWWIVSMGCLGLSLIYQMTGGKWGYASRPFFDAGIRTLPLVALAFVPLAMGLKHVYQWTEPGHFAGNPHALNRQWYLTEGFFIWRGIGYFAVWLVLGFLLTLPAPGRNGQMPTRLWPVVGGVGAVLVLNVASFAAVDWTMTLESDYYSTIHGAIRCGGAMLCGMCVVVAGVGLAIRRTGRSDEMSLTILQDLGKLLLAMLMVWAYLEFSQFLITYSGNLPATAAWYVHRLAGGWQWLAAAIVVFHFALPFSILLSRQLKRDPLKLAGLAIGLAAIHGVLIFWTIAPSFHKSNFHLHWLDVAVLAAVGGIWMAEFFRQLKHRLIPILPDWPYPGVNHG